MTNFGSKPMDTRSRAGKITFCTYVSIRKLVLICGLFIIAGTFAIMNTVLQNVVPTHAQDKFPETSFSKNEQLSGTPQEIPKVIRADNRNKVNVSALSNLQSASKTAQFPGKSLRGESKRLSSEMNMSPREITKVLPMDNQTEFNISVPSKEVPMPCSMRHRLERITHMCNTSPPPRQNTAYINSSVPALTSVLIDHERKTLACLISKASSTSWLRFLNKDVDHPNVTRSNKLSKHFGVTVDDVKRKFSDYVKFIVVKHPMQRLVSAYYETVIKRKYYRMTFNEFMTKMASKEIANLNEHWALYSRWCYPCDVTYDYVIKTETIDRDFPLMRDVLGMNPSATFGNANRNSYKNFTFEARSVSTLSSKYRYDKELNDYNNVYPDTFRKVQEWYQADMDIFGYGWNATSMSTCGYANDQEKCC